MFLVSDDEGYSAEQAARLAGISYRQVDYWARTDLVRPSLRDAAGSGSRRQYSYRDLLELKVIKSLLDAGIKLEQVRKLFDYLRGNLGEDIASANLVISGRQVLLVRDDGELIDLVRRGQGVLNILALGSLKEQIDAAIVELHHEESMAVDTHGTDTDDGGLRAVGH